MLPSLLLAAVMYWLRWAPAPFLIRFGYISLFLILFLYGSIYIFDRGKYISIDYFFAVINYIIYKIFLSPFNWNLSPSSGPSH